MSNLRTIHAFLHMPRHDECEANLQIELPKIKTFFEAHELTLTIDKTTFLHLNEKDWSKLQFKKPSI